MFKDFTNWLSDLMNKRYIVQLSDEDRRQLTQMSESSAAPPQARLRAGILLAAHEGQSDQQIAGRFSVSVATVQRTRRRYVTVGLGAAIGWEQSRRVADTGVGEASESESSHAVDEDWVAKVIAQSRQIEGVVEVALVDYDTSDCLGGEGFEAGRDEAMAANVDLVQAKLATLRELQLTDEIEDILITLSTRYHLIRVLPPTYRCFLYVALDRQNGNLAMARHCLRSIEVDLAG